MAKLGLYTGPQKPAVTASWAAFSRGSLTELLSASKLIVMAGSSVPLLAVGGLCPTASWLSAPTVSCHRPFTRCCFSKASRSLQSAQMEAYM